MTVLCALVLAAVCADDAAIDRARTMLRQGLLAPAESLLAPLADASDPAERARALLLLGNVDYERGRYEQALECYRRAESASPDDGSTAATARANQALAEQRLQRARELQGLEGRLRVALALAVAVGLAAVTALARRSRLPPSDR